MMGFGVLELRVFHYLLLPVGLLAACRWAFGPYRRLSFPFVFLVTWLLLVHAQAVEIYLGNFPSRLFLESVWLTAPLVLLAAGIVMRGVGHQVAPLRPVDAPRPGADRDSLLARATPFCTAGALLLTVVYIYDIGIRNVALFFLFANPGSAAEAMVLRISALDSRISPLLTFAYSYSRALLFPMYAATATVLMSSGRIRRVHWAVIIAITSFFALLAAAKAPLAFLLVGVGVAAYLAQPKRVRLGRLSAVFAVAMFLPALVYPLLTGTRGLDALTLAASSLWRRVTYVTAVTGAMHFDAFPAIHPFMGAASNRALATVANVPYSPTAEWVFRRYMYSSISGGRVNTAFFASFYADWGMTGVVLGDLLVGALLGALQVFFDRLRRRDAITVAVHATTMIAMTQLMMTNFYGIAVGRGMILLPLMLAGLNLWDASAHRRVAARNLPYAGSGT